MTTDNRELTAALHRSLFEECRQIETAIGVWYICATGEAINSHHSACRRALDEAGEEAR